MKIGSRSASCFNRPASRTNTVYPAHPNKRRPVPLLVGAVVLFLMKRNSTDVSLVYAFGIALSLKVMHASFPERYFKYILILASLAVVTRILIYLLQTIAFPHKKWLLKQYRETYKTFLFPLCNYSIHRGPLKYVFRSRRSIGKLRLVASFPTDQPDES